MGRTYLFECAKCGYRAKVSGGADEGFHFFVQTIVCRDCKKIYDAVTRLRVVDESRLKPLFPLPTARSRAGKKVIEVPPTFDAALNRMPLSGARRYKWIPFKISCPVSAVHKVQSWKDPGKCPACGYYLEKNALPFRIWE